MFPRLLFIVVRITYLLIPAVALLSMEKSAQAQAPASAPAQKIDRHEKLMADVRKSPLIVPTLVTFDGKPLSDQQKKVIEESTQMLKASREAALKGSFKDASSRAGDAAGNLRRILGEEHHRTITAAKTAEMFQRIASAPPEQQTEQQEALRLLNEAKELYEKGNYDKSEETAQKCIEIIQKLFGEDSAALVEPLKVLGASQIDLQRVREALKTLERARDLAERFLGSNHPLLALVLDRLGWLQINMGEFQSSITSFRKAIRIFRDTVGDNGDAAEALDNLGTALAYTKATENALQAKLSALWIRESVLGPEDKSVGVSLSNLAWLYGRLGNEEDILPLRERAAAIFSKALGPDHPYTQLEQDNIASVHEARREFDKAATILAKLVAQDEHLSNPKDPAAVRRRATYARVLLFSSKTTEGLEQLQKSISASKSLKAAGLSGAAMNQMRILAGITEEQNMVEDAIKIYEQMRAWDVESGKAMQREEIDRARRLASLYFNAERLGEAKELMLTAVKAAREQVGEDSLELAESELALATIQERMGEFEAAEQACDRVLRIMEQRNLGQGLEYALALQTMGRINTGQKRHDLAIFNFEQARGLLEKAGQQHPIRMIKLLQDLGACQQAAGQREEAVKSLRESLKRCRELKQTTDKERVDDVLAGTLKRLVDVLGPEDGETSKLRTELRAILDKLSASRALSGETRGWLEELKKNSPS